MNDIVKVCKKHGELTKKDTHSYFSGKYLCKGCRLCKKEQHALHRKKNQQKITQRIKEYYQNNPDKAHFKYKRHYENNKEKLKKKQKKYLETLTREEKITRSKIYRDKNAEKIKEWSKQWYRRKGYLTRKEAAKRESDNLGDTYLKKLIRQYTILKCKDVPTEIIELKRLQLKIKRLFKESKNGDK